MLLVPITDERAQRSVDPLAKATVHCLGQMPFECCRASRAALDAFLEGPKSRQGGQHLPDIPPAHCQRGAHARRRADHCQPLDAPHLCRDAAFGVQAVLCAPG